MPRISLPLLGLALSVTTTHAQHTGSATSALDPFVSAVAALGPVPGFAIVVAQDDEVVYLKGFGMADVEVGWPFTPQTVAYIASSTKSFTGLTAALLEHQGRLDLDAPLSRYLTPVALGPGLDAESITIRHLLTHTHGIADGGPIVHRTAFTGEHTPELLVQLLASYEPAAQGRAFRYGNLGYNVASLAMDAVTGRSWKDLEQELIFGPLGMTSTTAYRSRVDPSRLAMPYRPTPDGGHERVPFHKTDENMHAAGGLMTTAEDLAKWLEVNVTLGVLDGRRVFPETVMREAHAPLVEQDVDAGPFHRVGYGLGWNVGLLDGDTVIHHNGGFSGHRANVSFMPQHRIGVAILTNDGMIGGNLADLLTQFVYDRLRETPGTDEKYAAILERLPGMLDQAYAAVRADRERRAQRSQILPHPKAAYTGSFENPSLGRIDIVLDGGRFVVRSGVLETNRVEVYDADANRLRIELTGRGEVVTVEIEGDHALRIHYRGMPFERIGG